MKSESLLVSVIIPTYDRPGLLQRAIKSVVSQTYEDLEIIVVDDCPSNPVEEVIDTFSDDRINYILHEQNKGVCGARNTGIKESHGQLLAFLDDDDKWKRKKIEKQIEVIQNNSRVGLVYTGVRQVDDSGNTLSVSKPDVEGNITKQLLLGDFMSFSSILVSREVIEKSGYLDGYLTNWEDWEWCIRLSQHTDVGFVDQPLVTSYRGSHEMRSDDFEKKRDIGYTRFVEKVQPVATQYGSLFKRKFNGYLNYHLGYDALSNGYYSDARKRLFIAVRYWPFHTQFYIYLFFAGLGHRSYKTAQSVKRWISNRIH